MAAHLLPWHQIMMSQTLDDYVLPLGCGLQGLTEVGIVQGATGMEGHDSLETGSHGLQPSWGITRGAGAKAREWAGMACSAQPSSLGSADVAS